MPDIITSTMLKLAWTGMLLGVVSGAVIGLFFAREDWMGGYSGWRRRLTRLGHISFFGLGFVNFFFAFTHHALHLDPAWALRGAWAFAIGAATMPAVCFLSAWRKPLRHLFFIPVSGVAVGVLCTFIGWP